MEASPIEMRDLGVALNEARVVALDVDVAAATVDLRVDVLALGEGGDGPPDRRRTFRFTGVDRLRAAVRVGGLLAPVVPLASPSALSAFVAGLPGETFLLGGDFFDDPELWRRWPASSSLEVFPTAERPATHTFSWSIDAVRGDGRRTVFDLALDHAALEVLDAGGAPIESARVLDETRRFWRQLSAGDSIAVFVRDGGLCWQSSAASR